MTTKITILTDELVLSTTSYNYDNFFIFYLSLQDRAVYTCDEGYQIVGLAKVVCQGGAASYLPIWHLTQPVHSLPPFPLTPQPFTFILWLLQYMKALF